MEPILDMYKPPGLIKKIYFRRLTFGNAPIRIDNVWVDKQTPEELILEVCQCLPTVWGTVSPWVWDNSTKRLWAALVTYRMAPVHYV